MVITPRKDISVILPVYNGASMLESCVGSVRSAGKRIAELIIVDDGSTDGSGEKAEALAGNDPWIKVIRTKNHGSYTARVTGIRAAVSPYIAFIDVDDRYCSGALDLLADLLELHEADAAMGGIIETSSPDEKEPGERASAVRVCTVGEIWPRIMKWKTQEFVCYVWNKLYRRELFSDLLPAEGLCQGDDVLLTCQAFLKVKKTVETAAPVYLYYQNPDSLMHAAFGDRDLDLIRVWDSIVHMMRSESPKLYRMALFNRWRTDFTLICRLILADNKELDKKYAGELKEWRNGLRKHWSRLISAHAMPLNRELLILGLRFAYIPVKAAMRLGKRLTNRQREERA